MSLTVHADPVPLRAEENGTLRVGDSRISLDVLIEEYEKGASPTELVAAFDTLQLADVYAVLAYYHRHQDEIVEYLRRRKQEADEIRRKLEAAGMTWPDAGPTLLARKAAREQDNHAAPRQ